MLLAVKDGDLFVTHGFNSDPERHQCVMKIQFQWFCRALFAENQNRVKQRAISESRQWVIDQCLTLAGGIVSEKILPGNGKIGGINLKC